jgi:hypothetical protein
MRKTGSHFFAARSSPGASAAAVALLFASLPAPCVAGETPSGFNYCAPPLRPACIDAADPPDSCERDVQAFIKSVFKYRSCLEKESERAVREANDALEAWKCYTGALQCR